MFSNENYRRSLNAFTSNMLRSLKKTFIIVFAILACLPVINFMSLVSAKSSDSRHIITSSSGILSLGFITVLITLSIAFFVSTGSSEIFTQFVWPINRSIYALGNFLVMLACSVVSISAVSVLLLFELIPVEISKAIFNNDFVVVSGITFENFIAGFWVSICYIMLFSSLSYFLGMYFFRHKIITAVVFSLFLMLMSNPFVSNLYRQIYLFVFSEQSIIVFSIKAWLITLLLHALAYIQLKRMEVRI